jgi:Right handed beta helix region
VVLVTIAGTAIVAVAKPAGAVSVTSEAELKAAFATETHIDILADIVLTDCTDGGAVERASAVTDPVTVDGHGHTVLQTCEDNVFLQDGSGLLTVRNLVITGGRASGNGGGIFAAGPVTVNNSTIAFNQANAAGGGIGSNGIVTVTNSTVDSNSSSGEGGGIHLGPASHVLTLTNSTVSNNVGGGIGTPPNDPEASVTVVNSTVTRNRLVDLGGGIFSSGSTTLVYATVVDNSANTAFSNIDTGSLASFGSVVAQGAEGNCLANPTTSHGYNLSDDDTCGFTEPTDREDAGDPLLGPLAANGGATRTLLPQPGSPLIDAIATVSCQGNGAAGITADQRGVARPQGLGCDIGAVEVEVSIPPAPPPRPPAPVAAVPRFTG